MTDHGVKGVAVVTGGARGIGAADYGSAKAAVVGFTRAIARELAPHGINVNAVGPGGTRTRALEEWDSQVIDAVASGIPVGPNR